MSVNNSQRKPTTNIRHKAPLLNAQTLVASCGYGEGATRDEAIADALMKAKAPEPAHEARQPLVRKPPR